MLLGWAYAPALRVPFYLDDYDFIVESEPLHLDELSLEALRHAAFDGHLPKRPVSNLSFGLNHLIAGLDPVGFHLGNVLVHLAAVAAFAWLAWTLAGSLPAALVGATLFAVHPLASQAVTYVAQRMTSLAALFVLLALACYAGARRSSDTMRGVGFAGCAVFGVLALGSKEIAFMLPPVLLLYELCFHRADRSRQSARTLTIVALAALAALVGGAIVVASLGGPSESFDRFWYYEAGEREFTPLERMLTETRIVWFYVSLLLWPAPSRLNLEHDVALSTGLLAPATTLLAIAGWVSVGVLAVELARRVPRYGFPLLAFLAFHVIESGPLPLELVFEQRMYLPMAMLGVLGVVALADLPPRGRPLAMVLCTLLAVPLAAATHARNELWTDPLAFYTDAVEKSPRSFRANYELGRRLQDRGDLAGCLVYWDRALARRDDPFVYLLAGRNAFSLGQRARAVGYLQRSVAGDDENAEAVFNLAILLHDDGRFAEAASLYAHLVDMAARLPDTVPNLPEIRRRLAAAKQRLAP